MKNGIGVKKRHWCVCVGVWWCAEVNEDEGALSTGLPHTRKSWRLGPGAQSTSGCCCSAVFASPFLQLCAPAGVAWPSPCSLSLGSGLVSQRVLLGECGHSDVPQGWSSSVVSLGHRRRRMLHSIQSCWWVVIGWRYGLRGVRLGEARNPGPPRISRRPSVHILSSDDEQVLVPSTVPASEGV